MKFAVACLLGLVSASNQDTTTVWSLKSVNDHRDDQAFQKFFGDYQTDQANARPPYRSHAAVQSESETSSDSSDSEEDVQVRGDDSESDHSKEFYNAWNAVKDEEEGYHRVIPAHFSGDDDDLFMRSMCKTYALEGKNKDGSPNGNFQMDEAVTRAAASEVLETHKGLTGDAKKKYLDTYFPRTWALEGKNKDGSPNGNFQMDEAVTRAAASEVLETHKGLTGDAKKKYLDTYFPRTWAHFDVTKDGKIDVIKMPQFMRFLASDQYMSLLP